MSRWTELAMAASLALVTACGGGNLPWDPDAGDVLDPGQPDVAPADAPDTAVPDEGRDVPAGEDLFDAGQCECKTDDECKPSFPNLGQCERAYCDPATCKCVSGDAIDGTPCDDGDACTDSDACKAGACVSGLNLCDCEKDADCAAFEDGNLCNGTLVCDLAAMPTVCIVDPATVIVCNDDLQVPCKTKECDPPTGQCIVVNLDESKSCDDGNECTENDKCVAGECKGDHTVACDDGDACTTDACVFGKGCVFTPIDCDDGNDCTLELPCDKAAGCVHAPDGSDPKCALVVEFDAPDRALGFSGGGKMTVNGHIVSPAGPVKSFFATHDGWLDPQPDTTQFSQADGTFSFQVDSTHGLNLLQAEVEDSFGRRDRAVRSYYYSPEWYVPQTMVPDGIMGFVGPEVWDDDDTSDLDDFATLLTLLANGFDPLAYVSNPVTTQSLGGCEFQVNLLAITFGDLSVDLTPKAGGLEVLIEADDFKAQVHAPASGAGCTDIDGWLAAPKVKVSGTLNVNMSQGLAPAVSMTDTTVEIPSLSLEPDCNPYCGLVEPVRLLIQAIAVVEINDLVPQKVLGALAETVHETLDTGSIIPGGWPAVPLELGAGFSTVQFTDAGAVVGMSAGVWSLDNSNYPTPGSIGRAKCLGVEGDITFPNAGPIEIAVHDDLLNQISHAFHSFGAFSFPISAQQVLDHGVDLAAIGITDVALEADAHLPPIATSCNSGGELEGQIGDVAVTASMKVNGSYVKARFWISLAAGVGFGVQQTTPGTVLGLSAKDPHVAAYDMEILEGNPGMTADEFEKFLDDNLLPQLKAVLAGTVEEYLVPQIDLQYYIDTYLAAYVPSYFPKLPAGSVLDMTVTDLLRALGYSVLSGSGS